jgi:hypothetical protein
MLGLVFALAVVCASSTTSICTMVQSLTQRQCTIVATMLAPILAEMESNRISGVNMCTVMVQLVSFDGNDAW